MIHRRSRSIFLHALASLTLSCSTIALAQSPEQVCAPDIQAYCAGVPHGEGRIAQCLRANEAKLSPACRQGMAKAATLMKEVVQACEDDVHRFCAGAAQGTAKECLRTNFRELSMGCKRELFEAKREGM
ncbi:MAG TPA: cysteine rich repeat-containing protein [Casimicrobiaceae bacterium]|jgi:hypothetical protein|nr:cysteine rich repeat-containing protein [Casimicrobiaceae bacterium]